jgi:undecaprenyl-diphosphatase
LIGVHQLVEESGFSFPSKHAVSAFVLATFVFFHNKRLSFLVFFFGILIALGRIFVGVHFPTDVIGGARKVFLLAAAIAAAAGAWAYLNGGSSQEGAQAPIAGSEKAGE